MEPIPVYCMPGMAASPKIFEYLDFPKPFQIHLLSWIPPKKQETLSAYAQRMCERIEYEHPVLLGVSFGGVLVQEMAKHIRCPQYGYCLEYKKQRRTFFSHENGTKNKCPQTLTDPVDQ
jgi:hypothetical protein